MALLILEQNTHSSHTSVWGAWGPRPIACTPRLVLFVFLILSRTLFFHGPDALHHSNHLSSVRRSVHLPYVGLSIYRLCYGELRFRLRLRRPIVMVELLTKSNRSVFNWELLDFTVYFTKIGLFQ